MGDVLAQIAFGVEAKMGLRNRVAPLDLVTVVEHCHAIRRSLDSLDKTGVLLFDLTHLCMPALGELVQPIIDFTPCTRRAGYFAIHRLVEQTPQPLGMKGREKAL